MRMLNLPALALTGLGLLLSGPAASLAAGTPDPYSQPATCNANTRADPAALSPLMPCDVPTSGDKNDPTLIQQSFDTFSWQSFVALASPLDGRTAIGQGAGPGGDAPAAWQGWADALTIMTPDPPAWGQVAPPPAACAALVDGTTPMMSMVGKTPDLLEAADQPFDTGPLIDQNGLYVRYQILINKPMYDFIIGNKLNTRAGQAAYKPTQTPPNATRPMMTFPGGLVTGSVTPGQPVATAPGYDGAVMLKLAWKVMGRTDDPATFHTMDALVYTKGATPDKDTCQKQKMGLVGLHIGNKVQRFPQWVWSTFEHVRNVPQADDVARLKSTDTFNFYRVGCSPADCPVNKPPPHPWNPAVQPFPNGYKSQVTRVIALVEAYKQMNAKWQAPLKGSVWAHYMLIGTQWPTQQNNKANPTGFPFPQFLANTTMETYIQGTVPQSSSSCIFCHNNAVDTAGTPSDFTYILERAAP
ncbi:hypothetical protein [Niveispirillum fermenti]|uniref:hypothetical protein n=1 Tax=Niveispirillum fermenti TaxID=1233113 RepID=UPI003A86B59E